MSSRSKALTVTIRAHGGHPFIDNGDGTADAAYFHCANRGKTSQAIDFSSPEGKAAVIDLIRDADVVIENFKVGNAGALWAGPSQPVGDQSAADLLLDHGIWPDRTLCSPRRI